MIGTIRKHQQWLWGIIILAIIVSFVVYFSPNSRNLMDSQGSYDFGSINNHPITREQYRAAYAENELLYFLRSGNKWPGREESEDPNFKNAIYSRIAFIEKLKELKVEPTVDATAKWITEVFRGPGEQAFPMDRYQAFVNNELKSHQLTSEDFYRFARHQVAQEHLIAVYGLSGKLITPQEAESFYRRLNEPISTEAVFFTATNFLNTVAVTPSALGEFYTNNMADYRLRERLQVNYIKWDTTNFLAEADKELGKITNLAQRIESAYLQRGTNVFRDESGKPLSLEAAKAKIKEDERKRVAVISAQKKANEFLTELYEGRDEKKPLKPDDMEKLAKAKNLEVKTTPPFDEVTGAMQLKLSPYFVQSAFGLRNADPEESVKGVPTEEGVYVIALNKRIPSETQEFEKVRAEVTKDFREQESLKLARQAGAAFEKTATNAVAQGKTFATASAEMKLTPVILPNFSLSSRTLPQLDSHVSLDALQSVVASLAPGKTSGFVPTANGGFVLYLKAKQPVDEALLKKELPEFMARQREQRMSAAFFDWFQKLPKEMNLVLPA
ncbi:MAG: SurA N-terminal domain-containing protein, partial [Verrucomicrobiota bacterium]